MWRKEILKILLKTVSTVPAILLFLYLVEDNHDRIVVLKYFLGFAVTLVIIWIVYLIANYKYGK